MSRKLEVLQFINKVLEKDRMGCLEHVFADGYCYYFAKMLQEAFGGQVAWVQDTKHVVWVDCDKEWFSFDDLQRSDAYDVYGPYDDFENLWPISYLGKAVVEFKHNAEKYHVSDEFKMWCDSCGITEIYGVTYIWQLIPMSIVFECYNRGLDVELTSLLYWRLHAGGIAALLASKTEITRKHNGIELTL